MSPQNAILLGLIGTPLTYNEQRFRAAIAQSNRVPSNNPTTQEAWDARVNRAARRGWLQPEDVSPVAVFLASTPLRSLLAPNSQCQAERLPRSAESAVWSRLAPHQS